MTVQYGQFKAGGHPLMIVRSSSPTRTRALRAGLLLSMAAALAACASLPADRRAAQPKPPEAYATAQSFSAPAADWPAQDWWRAYGDAQLDRLIDGALANSPTMAQAEARV